MYPVRYVNVSSPKEQTPISVVCQASVSDMSLRRCREVTNESCDPQRREDQISTSAFVSEGKGRIRPGLHPARLDIVAYLYNRYSSALLVDLSRESRRTPDDGWRDKGHYFKEWVSH